MMPVHPVSPGMQFRRAQDQEAGGHPKIDGREQGESGVAGRKSSSEAASSGVVAMLCQRGRSSAAGAITKQVLDQRCNAVQVKRAVGQRRQQLAPKKL